MLISTDDVYSWWPQGGPFPPERDAELGRTIGVASAMIERACRRVFEKAAITEWHDGDGGDTIMLRRPPVWALTSVSIDGLPIVASTYVVPRLATDSDAAVDVNDGRLIRTVGVWPVGVRNIAVAYTGGFEPIPPPVAQACLQLVAHLTSQAGVDVGMAIEQAGEYRVDRRPGGPLPPAVRRLLAPYRLPMPQGLAPGAYERLRSSAW
jgi:hypothetical protein